MTRQELIDFIENRGYTKSKRSDKIWVKGKYRYVISKIHAKKEVAGERSDYGYLPWYRLRSAYLKNITINGHGKIEGMIY
jgi:hypothetical protein